MKYIIDEEDLKNLDFTVTMSQKPREEVSNWIEIMESKQPVEQYELIDDTTIYTTKGRVSMCFKSKIYIQKVKGRNV